MLFLVKRGTWPSLVLLAALAALGLGFRQLLPNCPPLALSPYHLLLGLAAFGLILVSDALLHGLFLLTFGDRYRRRHRQLVELFRCQSVAAMFTGALLAGIGEELVFRGLSMNPAVLAGAAAVFGALHHIRRDLWPFSVWAAYQGLLLAGALWWTEALCVPMMAHFLHDLAGFGIFRFLNRRATPAD